MMTFDRFSLRPAQLLMDYESLFEKASLKGPILDIACGDAHNGIFLAQKSLPVICCDISPEALARARKLAARSGTSVRFWEVDLESGGTNPLPESLYGGVLVFRYLHRPLIPCIKKSLKPGGILVYETFTWEQPKFGKPRNPNYLLKKGELLGWFKDWEIMHHFEGLKENPKRAVAQIVCRKPSQISPKPSVTKEA